MLNWGAFAAKCAQTDFKLGSDIMSLTANHLSHKTRQIALKAKSENYAKQAKDFVGLAGDVQKQGRQANEQIGMQLGEQVGRAYASAAGSGISVNSASVAKGIKDMRTEADNARAIQSYNEFQTAQNAINKSLEAATNKVWNDFALKQDKKADKREMVWGALSAANNWVGGMIDAGGSLFGGMSGMAGAAAKSGFGGGFVGGTFGG